MTLKDIAVIAAAGGVNGNSPELVRTLPTHLNQDFNNHLRGLICSTVTNNDSNSLCDASYAYTSMDLFIIYLSITYL